MLNAATKTRADSRPDGFPATARVVEVGNRDGLQAESLWIPIKVKIEILNELISAFVSPRAVPQLRRRRGDEGGPPPQYQRAGRRRDGLRLTL
jgi:hypothetical protein